MRAFNWTGPEERYHIHRRMLDLWDWVAAIDAFDFNDPKPLNALRALQSDPPELRNVLASIDAGDRQPNRKAAAKLKIPAAERMKVAATLSGVLGLIETLKTQEIFDGSGELRRAIEIGADRRRREPIDEVRELEAATRKLIADTAKSLGVSVEAVENLLRDMRRKVANWPNI